MNYRELSAILKSRSPLVSFKSVAPTRIDLAGGTLDIWPVYLLLDRPSTVNVAIDVMTQVVVEDSGSSAYQVDDETTGRTLSAESGDALAGMAGAEIAGRLISFFAPHAPCRLRTKSFAPPQSGLGASSSLGIAIAGGLNAVTGFRYGGETLVEIVKNVEAQVLGAMTGSQDHIPALYGGAACLWWGVDGVRREALPVDTAQFESHFLLAYTHQPHRSGANNWEVVKRFLDGDRETRGGFEKIAEVSRAMKGALTASDFGLMAELLGEEWNARRKLAPAVGSPELDALLSGARRAGALSGKACGAGGGGCLVLAVPPEKRDAVSQAVERAGGSVIPFKVSKKGLHFDSTGGAV